MKRVISLNLTSMDSNWNFSKEDYIKFIEDLDDGETVFILSDKQIIGYDLLSTAVVSKQAFLETYLRFVGLYE